MIRSPFIPKSKGLKSSQIFVYHRHLCTLEEYTLLLPYRLIGCVYTIIHLTNMATFAVLLHFPGVYTNPAAAFSLHFFNRFHKYPLWYPFFQFPGFGYAFSHISTV